MNNAVILRLVNTLTVRDAMTPLRALKRADDAGQAAGLFDRFDVVPYPSGGAVEGFFHKSSPRLTLLAPEHLISDSTSLFELPGLLALSPFYFVLGGSAITGFVHFSDLNRGVNRIPLYTLVQALEYNLWDRVDERIDAPLIHRLFGEDGKGIIAAHRRNEDANIHVGWAGVFTFANILRLARHFELIDLNDDEINLVKEARNKAAHSDQNLVNNPGDVQALVEAYRLLNAMLERL